MLSLITELFIVPLRGSFVSMMFDRDVRSLHSTKLYGVQLTEQVPFESNLLLVDDLQSILARISLTLLFYYYYKYYGIRGITTAIPLPL